MLSEIRQAQKDIYYVFSHTCESLKSWPHKVESRIEVTRKYKKRG
jgi:hypothetical protein